MLKMIDHPDHYQGCAEETRYIVEALGVHSDFLEGECIEAIEKLELNFHIGNAVKYLWRCGQKGDPSIDLRKARWYIERHREKYSAATFNRDSNAIAMIESFLDEVAA